jgi:hypothetical protein
VRQAVDALLADDPGAAIVAVGDFNDDIESPILLHEAGFAIYDGTPVSASTGVLHNLSGLLPEGAGRGTYFYNARKSWHAYDSASVSRGMLPEAPHPAPWQAVTNRYAPFALPRQRDTEGQPLPYRRIRKKEEDGVVRSRFIAGYADHFPIRLELMENNPLE